ncbi:hypothetical protein JA9_003127 [Meyerozyma sp. JA9]|nr:hypothetical protein JA9_003127 [Meyerozyma sp. JA9]
MVVIKVAPDNFDLFLRFRNIKHSALVTRLDEFSDDGFNWASGRWYRTHEEERPSRHGSLSRFGTPQGSDGSGSEAEVSDGDVEMPEEHSEEHAEEHSEDHSEEHSEENSEENSEDHSEELPEAQTGENSGLQTDERTDEPLPKNEGDSDEDEDFHSQDRDSDVASEDSDDEEGFFHGTGQATEHLSEVKDYGSGVRRIIGHFSSLTDMKHDALFHGDPADPAKEHNTEYEVDFVVTDVRLKDWLGLTPNNNELEPRAMRQSIYPINSQSAFLDWECHDETTLKEITEADTIYSTRRGYEDCDGGLKDPFRPGLTSLDTISFSSVMRDAPSSKFRDGLKVSFVDYKRINQAGSVRRYKNNIAGIITDCDGHDFLVTVCESCLVFHEFDPLTQHPKTEVCFAFETKPGFTTAWDRYVSMSPENPHVINYLKVYDNWLGRQVLVACVDDGMVLMWYSTTIIEQISKHRQRFRGTANLEDMRTTIYSVKIKPDFEIRLRDPAWGVDLSTYKDDHGDIHHVVVASDNSRTITVLYYHVGDDQFYSVANSMLSHNIPEVSFVRIVYDDGIHCAVVAAASISSELVTLSFMFYLAHGPLSHAHNELSGKPHIANIQPNFRFLGDVTAPVTQQIESKLDRLYLLAIVVTNRTELPEDCWTVKVADPSCFLPVQSLRAMTGDPSLNEEMEITRIMNESRVLKGQCDPVQTSFLGLAAECQFYEAPVVNIEGKDSDEDDSDDEDVEVCGIDEECRRMSKSVEHFYEYGEKPVESLNGNRYHKLSTFARTPMLAVTTEHRACLFSSQTMFCFSGTKKIFKLTARGQVDLPSARLSISHIIPELSCFIVISQQGLASIFRLCQHRGVYGMRQEHILPSARSLSEIYAGGKTICGLAVRRASAVLEDPRYFLYITYTDGLVISYEIRAESPVSTVDV